MDGAASVIAVIQLTASILKICGGYLREVKESRNDIMTLQRSIAGLEGVLQKLKEHFQNASVKNPPASSLCDNMNDCLSYLRVLEEKMNPGGANRMMKRLGIRALKWPFKRTEVEKVVQNLERYKSTFILALQLDQTSALAHLTWCTDRIHQGLGFDKVMIALDAEFDSYTDQHESECLVGTRTEILRQITDWTVSPQGNCIFWLNGMAGTGKSTIARTVAKSLREAKLLGASFFFKRGEVDRGNAKKFIPTIIKQLVVQIPELLPHVQERLEEEPNIIDKPLGTQFEKLLFRPLLSLKSTCLGANLVLVIDALDECERDEDIRIILQLLPQLCNPSTLHIKVFLTSRPELPVRLGFSKITSCERQALVLHEIPEQVITHDISMFLEHRLSVIAEERSLPHDWPGDTVIQSLVNITAPLFISAATVSRLLEDPQWDPVDSLAEILTSTHRNDGFQFDATYLPTLNRLVKGQTKRKESQLIQEFGEVVGTIVILETPLSVVSISRLLGLSERQVDLRLRLLHSVLRIPENQTHPVRLFHLSFRDFLLDPETRHKTPFWIDEKEVHQRLARRCLSVCGSLKQNICQLSYDTKHTEIDRWTIDQHMAPELQYACRYWAHHVTQSKVPIAETENAVSFLQTHLQYWMEAMSILGLFSEAVEAINLLQTILHAENDFSLSEFLHKTKKFAIKCRERAEEMPLRIYSLDRPFPPYTKAFPGRDEHTRTKSMIPSQDDETREVRTFEGHSNGVRSVAFSPDGRLLASGSYDKTVRLWEAATGNLQQTLEGHYSGVRSVAFSPDGRLLASGSYDKTVRLWETTSGVLQHTLNGHSSGVRSVSFSPDGRLLASGSWDKTVRLWDVTTGVVHHTLRGHSDWVHSVAFSPDGRQLASGSRNQQVRLWNVTTGALQQTLSVDGTTALELFDGFTSYLSTDVGSLSIQSWCHEYNTKLNRRDVKMYIRERQWIVVSGTKELRLSCDSRTTCAAFRNFLLALGHNSGRISLVSIDPELSGTEA